MTLKDGTSSLMSAISTRLPVSKRESSSLGFSPYSFLRRLGRRYLCPSSPANQDAIKAKGCWELSLYVHCSNLFFCDNIYFSFEGPSRHVTHYQLYKPCANIGCAEDRSCHVLLCHRSLCPDFRHFIDIFPPYSVSCLLDDPPSLLALVYHRSARMDPNCPFNQSRRQSPNTCPQMYSWGIWITFVCIRMLRARARR